MRILITGGGTAGHITPLLAVATEINNQYPDADIRYIGQFGDPMQIMLADQSTINKSYKIFAGKWRRYHGLGFWGHIRDFKTLLINARDLIYFCLGFIQSMVIIIFWRPKVVFVKGGYVGLPVGLAAAVLRVPIVTHDSDTIPGLTNRILSKFAKLQAVGLPVEAYKNYYNVNKLRFTGVPIRHEYYNINLSKISEIKNSLSINNDDQIITIIGGSLGAVRLNEILYNSLNGLLINQRVHLIWVTGNNQFNEINQRLAKYGNDKKRVHLFKFLDNLQDYLFLSDVVVSRAGATSIAELATLSKATILVPNPLLAGGHQVKNAQVLSDKNAVILLDENQLTESSKQLIKSVKAILSDDNLRQNLQNNLHKLAFDNSAKLIVKLLEEAC